MLSQLGRDLSTAEQRILDHRAFVNGEINNFLNEFELKRNEAEVETLFKVTEIIGDVKYDLYERCIILSTSHLETLNQEVNNLLVGVEGFLNKVELQKQPNEYLIQSRKDREHKRANFLIDLEHKYERVKNSFEEKEEEIDELYSDLQVKLNIPK
ncbi:biogenesis of lysosome-related organelles complex 1 subunit 5 [Bactrocera neohumeralis]|uniref:biogenesis of lysosome-related organelles complex 1 subunit 5 n=1 Tax=Bactrocera tryoni TaxID=59916 RepID=UPI001A96FAD8|nr:biogenesis of lysosome-related organelles complex 1 subunit 5 [Bactrocera tryoni]XP_050327561.1 biogenesis of lysosome-related organelles complex 1 subunit 5 [Bactrocera neohumeralis]